MFGRGKIRAVLASGLGDVDDILAPVRALMHEDGEEGNCCSREDEGSEDEDAGAEEQAQSGGDAEVRRLGLLASPVLAAKVLQLGGTTVELQVRALGRFRTRN